MRTASGEAKRQLRKGPSPRPAPLRSVADPGPPQTRRGVCEPALPPALTDIDRLPLLVMPEDERQILERHATDLAGRLLGADGQAELRELLARRLAVLDVEVQRLAAVQEIVLRKGTTRDNVRKARDINLMLASAHRRFTATADLLVRLSAPRVTLSIGAAENVAVVDARRSG